MKRQSVFSPDRVFRYTLWREWEKDLRFSPRPPDQFIQFVGLNPSTADEVQNDNTITRLIGFSRTWGYSAFCMTNVFAFRSRDPKFMKKQADPVGPENYRWLLDVAAVAGMVVCCWGRNAGPQGIIVADMLRRRGVKLHYFRMLAGGVPEHPLYLPKTLAPIEWKA